MKMLPQVTLKEGREKSLLKKHLWVFSGAIKTCSKQLEDGETVEVYSEKGEYLATGHFQKGSIAIRIFSFKKLAAIDHAFWKSMVNSAILRRKALGLFDNEETNAFRLIHGEGDDMPGLIADYYNGVIVLQAHSVGMFNLLPELAECFVECLGKDKVTAVFSKSGMTIKQAETDTTKDMFLYGDTGSVVISENGIKFDIDFVNGQKTGFFLDQKRNREILAQHCKGKSVLNIFCYTGAFSAYALANGASKVVSVDVSENAIEMTDHNVKLNCGNTTAHKSYTKDAFEFLTQNTEKFDIVILDPPAFAKHLDARNNAMKAYRRLNTLGIKSLDTNGLLFTFSCSQVISKTDFLTAVYNAATDMKRKVSIIYQLHQAPDHLINIFHPETEYLKGLALITD